MLHRESCYVYIFLQIFFIDTNALNIIDKSSEHLSRVLHDKSKNPLIVVVKAGNEPSIPDFDEVAKETEHSLFDEYSDDQMQDAVFTEEETVEQQAALMLKGIIQSPDNEYEDSSLKKTKNVLRQALRQRCQKVGNCKSKCPPKQRQCEVSCQQVFDNLNLCEEPTTTRRPRNCATGKTMPPTWRF